MSTLTATVDEVFGGAVPALLIPRAGHSSDRVTATPGPSSQVDDDRALIQAAQAGDETAFRGLVDRYSKRVYWIAYHMVGNEDEAYDISQEAFIRVFRSIGRFKLEYKFYTWLYQIVHRLAIDSLRKRPQQARRVSMEELGEVLRARGIGPHGELEAAELKDRVQAVLADLPPKYRTVIVLRDIEGFSSKEIADIVGSTHATVRWRLHRARSLFRDAWEKRFPGSLPKGSSSGERSNEGEEADDAL